MSLSYFSKWTKTIDLIAASWRKLLWEKPIDVGKVSDSREVDEAKKRGRVSRDLIVIGY
jgi:hypothetical protein